MANYQSVSRTNYFKVKDEAAFRTWAESYELEVIEKDGLLGLIPSKGEDGAFDLLDADDEALDIGDEIAAHLTDDSVAVVMEAGHEGARYVVGWALAINSKGERHNISIRDIYEQVFQKFGVRPTDCEY